MSGDVQNVVQTGSVENIIIGASHGKRGVMALAVVAVVLAVAVVLIVASSRGGTDRSDSEAATGGRPAEPPVAAVTSYNAIDCRSGWVMPDRGDDPIPFNSVKPSDGVLGSGGQVTVTVQGSTGRSVVLQSMTVDVVRRSPAVPGVYLVNGCQGEVPPRKSVLDLDKKTPRIAPEPDSVPFPYKVNDVEPEQFVITPEITNGAVEWRLRLHWTSGPTTGELVLDNDGKPFHTTATTAARTFCLDYKNSTWRPSC
jgi:hypothetical protein